MKKWCAVRDMYCLRMFCVSCNNEVCHTLWLKKEIENTPGESTHSQCHIPVAQTTRLRVIAEPYYRHTWSLHQWVTPQVKLVHLKKKMHDWNKNERTNTDAASCYVDNLHSHGGGLVLKRQMMLTRQRSANPVRTRLPLKTRNSFHHLWTICAWAVRFMSPNFGATSSNKYPINQSESVQ